jgi:RimJ/RimL family protein N-acetyltransferase
MITEESFLDFKCPYCGDPVSFPQDCAGMVRECPSCIESLIVPDDGSEVGRKPPIPITTPRLVLRRLAASDWQDLQALLADEELFRYAEGRPLEEEEILHWLESDGHVRLTSPGQPFYLGIQLQDGGKLIGYLRLVFTDAQRLQAALSIYLNRSFQKKGFGLEAVDALLAFCFEGIRLHRVAAGCDSRNTAACRLFESVGLRREGEFLKDNFFNGEWASTAWYAVLGQEYREAGAPAKQTTNGTGADAPA